MEPFPSDLFAALPVGARPVAERWWSGLSETDRQRLAELWDQRLEVSFFTPQPDSDGCVDTWEQVPVVRGGCFAPKVDDGRGEWIPSYFEHLLQHPELVPAFNPPRRTFHICTLHAVARECIATGHVALTFTCPVSAESCPMHLLRGARLTKPVV